MGILNACAASVGCFPYERPDDTESIEPNPKQRNNFTEGVTGTPIRLQNIGPLDRGAILEHLLEKIKTPLSGTNVLISLKEIGQDPTISKDAGVYLHILWRRDHPDHFWLYVGQAAILCIRIETHNDPYRRRRNPCLHYHIWDMFEDMESVFVTLATHEKPLSPETQLVLNIQEMWMCLLFQTLTPSHLDEFLPGYMDKLWSGNHLNVALPLWQGFTSNTDVVRDAIGGRITFQQYLWSNDPTIREWAEHARDAFNDIRNSPDPRLRGYYEKLHFQRRIKAQETVENKKAENLRCYMSEAEATVHVSHGGEMTEISCGMFRFTISRSLGLSIRDGDAVHCRFNLAESPHPNAYARRAEPRDPASRLAVSIRGKDSHGNFHVWLGTHGPQNVKKMNSLVDVLEGYTLEESRSFERRWHVKRDLNLKTNMYT
ncbi:hypothetical protein BDV59DRAFT_196889 [Aspergillus ambiguus]|uniref:uncharacterized protein n=1 Tax=Aspergillus ambiguus TaxID=176160 RepID=UPI003CCE4702